MASNEHLINVALHRQVGTTITQSMSTVIGTFVIALLVGRFLGSDALVGYGLAVPFGTVLLMVSSMIATGGSIIFSRFLGEGNYARAISNYSLVMIIALVLGSIATIVVVPFAGPISALLGATGDILPLTTVCVRATGLTAIPYMVFVNNLIYFKIDNDNRICIFSTTVYVLVMAVFALYSIFFTDWGLNGVAMSMVVGIVAGALFSLLHFRHPNRFLKFVRPIMVKDNIVKIFTAGIPTAFNTGSNAVRGLFLNWFLLLIAGPSAVLAFTVQANIMQVTTAFALAYGSIVVTLCGMFFGERDKRAMRDSVRLALKSGVPIAITLSIIVIIFAEPLVRLFIADGDISEAVMASRLLMVSEITTTVTIILMYMYQGSGNLVMSITMSFLRGIVFLIGSALLLSHFFGVNGVWISFLVSDLLTIASIFVIVRIRTGHFPRDVEDLFLKPEGCFVTDVLMEATYDIDEGTASRIRDAVLKACADDGIDPARSEAHAAYVARIIERMQTQDGKGTNSSAIDMRLFRDSEGLKVRIRNDGRKFNPYDYVNGDKEWIDAMREGTTLVNYRFAIRLNNLIVGLPGGSE